MDKFDAEYELAQYTKKSIEAVDIENFDISKHFN